MTFANFFLFTAITLLSLGGLGCILLLFSDTNRLILNVSNVKYCKEVVKWTGPILKKYGIKFYPNLVVRYCKPGKSYGLYSSHDNTIIIYLKKHTGDNFVNELTKTVLHETFHHVQSKTDPAFKKLTNYKKYGYFNNRIEVEARNFENKHYKECIQQLFDKGFLKKWK